jgi:hypothetical protein
MSTQKINNDEQPGAPSQKKSKSEAFYIGWMTEAPDSFSHFVKKYLFILLPLVVILAILLALSQKKFATGNFEFGRLTEVKGIYFKDPVPNLKVVNGKDIWGNYSYITVPLIGYGKHGADGVIADLEKQINESIEKKEVILKGTLLFNDGKLLMQIDGNDQPLVKISNAVISTELLPQSKDLGVQTIKGEIVDPKCYFGVMKPGQGKPHRDCAIRCILGGIPPVMKVQNSKGETNYYFIVGPNGEKMNEAVQDYVAEPTEITARLVQYDDWIVMYVKDKEAMNRISYFDLIGADVHALTCGKNCLQ